MISIKTEQTEPTKPTEQMKQTEQTEPTKLTEPTKPTETTESMEQFIPYSVVSFDEIERGKQIMSNDVFEKYEAVAKVRGQLIVCNDVRKQKKHSKKIRSELYEEYLISLKMRDPKKDEWIYNVIDGLAEQDKILYQDKLCIIIPTYIWNESDIDKMHLLCLPTDKSLRCIRSLEQRHLPLLEHMKNVTFDVIKNMYDLSREEIKTFFHYEPSTYHLHIHFVNLLHKDCGSSIEYTHDLNSVMFNLSLDSDYYKKIQLNHRF